MKEIFVQDAAFLYDYQNPTLVVIHQDINGRHIKTHEISLRGREFAREFWKQNNIEAKAKMIIAVPSPLKGTIVIGQESIVYYDGKSSVAVAPPIIKRSSINCYTRLDSRGFRYLLGSKSGNLFVLFLESEKNAKGELIVKDLKVRLLGELN